MSPPTISSEDYALIKPYIILPMILSAFERDKKFIESSGAFKTPVPYVTVIEAAMKRVSADIRDVKREFRKRGIKVYEVDRKYGVIEAKFGCRGYTGTFSLLEGYLVSQAGVIMCSYLCGNEVKEQ